MKPLLIAIEGIDGAGKSTLAKNLKAFLENCNRKCHITSEPWTSESGVTIQRELSNGKIPRANLFLSDRYNHQIHIDKMFLTHDVVITDRYMYSNMVYQNDSEYSMMDIKQQNIDAGIREADILILLDCDVNTAKKRINTRNSVKTCFETEDKLNNARQDFITLMSWHNDAVIIDANSTELETFNQARDFLIAN